MYDWDTRPPGLPPRRRGGSRARRGLPRQTFGHLVGEVVRRVNGKTLGQFVEEEIAAPLQADFHLGPRMSPTGLRIAPVVAPPRRLPMAFGAPPGTRSRSLGGRFTGPAVGPILPVPPTAACRPGGDQRSRQRPGGPQDAPRLSASVASRGSEAALAGRHRPDLRRPVRGADLVLASRCAWASGSPRVAGVALRPAGARTCFWGGWGGSMSLPTSNGIRRSGYVMNQMLAGH